MANALYDSYKTLLLTTGLNLSSLAVHLALVDGADYTFSAAHDFLDDISGGTGLVAESAALGSKTTSAGVFDAADTSFFSVSGDTSEILVGFIERGGADSANELLFYFDTGVTGLPVTPNGGNINVAFNGSGIFAL